ncbi:hypothetical protein [Rhizobium leguminosarum]|uniref:hypothetical protein n=1 Tax=Rhizobium leguminosarum TaxID=384 RepID=UPI001493E808|nr:hypothetical protein [Rhizobium leguminosarum]
MERRTFLKGRFSRLSITTVSMGNLLAGKRLPGSLPATVQRDRLMQTGRISTPWFLASPTICCTKDIGKVTLYVVAGVHDLDEDGDVGNGMRKKVEFRPSATVADLDEGSLECQSC